HGDYWSVSAVSADARTAALMPPSNAVYIIDVATGKARRTLTSPDRVRKAALSRDGQVLAAWMDQRLQVWDTSTGKLLHELTVARKLDSAYKAQWLALSADGKTLAWVGEDGACPIHVMDLTTGKELRRLEQHERGERQVS